MASLSNRLAANKRFEFTTKAFAADKFAVVSMLGQESISQLFRFELTLVSDDADIDFNKMLQNQASFRIFLADGATSVPYHGILSEFDQLHKSDGYVFYRAVLVPRAWRLSLFSTSDLYISKGSTIDVLKVVLGKAKFTSLEYDFKTTGTYDAREYVNQIDESNLDFISRWMERDGMYYYFDHSGDAEKMFVIDDVNTHVPDSVPVEYRPGDKLDTGAGNLSVQSFVSSQRPLPNTVTVQDYNYEFAGVTLKASQTVDANGIGEVMLHGENIRTEAEAERYAKLRAQELLCAAKLYFGESTVVGLRSGYFMSLKAHYREAFNAKYLVTEIEHRGSQAGALLNGIETPYNVDKTAPATFYSNSFQAIPAAVQFRAPRKTPWPRRTGTVSATVDSATPSNEYADLDEKGRYLVQLRFNQSTVTSQENKVRVRMAAPYAGKVDAADKDSSARSYGMHAPLHRGAEVLLSFEGGDPDRPVILGAVANSENPNVVNSKSPVTRIQTPGNSIVFDDTKGKESVTISSDCNNSTTVIGNGAVKGIWQSTSGSSVSLAVGDTTSVSAGAKNSFSVSIDNSLSASIATKMALGTSFGFSLGQDVSWKFGRSFSIDDSDSVSLKTDGKLQANDTVTISGGQRAAIKPMVESLKKGVKIAVAANTAANLLVAGGAATGIGLLSNAKGGKLGPWDGYGGAIHGAQAGLNTLITSVSHILLSKAAKAIAAVSKDATYASNITANGDGITMVADSAVPVRAARIDLTPKSVKMSASWLAPLGNSNVEVAPDTITLIGNAVGKLSSTLKLSAAEAKLGTDNPVGKTTVSHPTGGNLVTDSKGLKAAANAAGVSALNLATSGATLEFGSDKGFYAKPTKVSATFFKAGLDLSSQAAALSYASSSVSVSPAGTTIKGALIRLG